MTDLEEVSTDELLDELQRRYCHSVFCGAKEVNSTHDSTDVAWSGDMLKCAGLLTWATNRVMRDFKRTRRDTK